MHFGQVSGKLGLLKGAFQNVFVRYRNFTPGLHRFLPI
jgi:hypothetical protein